MPFLAVNRMEEANCQQSCCEIIREALAREADAPTPEELRALRDLELDAENHASRITEGMRLEGDVAVADSAAEEVLIHGQRQKRQTRQCAEEYSCMVAVLFLRTLLFCLYSCTLLPPHTAFAAFGHKNNAKWLK